MTTLASTRVAVSADSRFYFNLVATMALVIIAGFSFHLGMGRSTFAVPVVWHLHAFAFMGWVALVVTQTWLATRGPIAVHRTLGWLSVIWLPAMVVLGTTITVATSRRGTVPFFFLPQHFLVLNVIGLLTVAGLVIAALRVRKNTDWHQRLQICAFAALLGPAFGRLLPMPLMKPIAMEGAIIAGLLFPAYAMLREGRREGRIHSAWWIGIATVIGTMLLGEVIAYSPVGAAIYAAATAGSPGAAVPGLAFAAPPPGL